MTKQRKIDKPEAVRHHFRQFGMEGYMLLLDLKTEIFRRRERIRVHLKQFHHGHKSCQNKISHGKIEKDLKFLELLWHANSVEEIPAELLYECKPAFKNDLGKYFKLPQQSRVTMCEDLKNQFHRENGLGVANPEIKVTLNRLQELGMDQISASRLLCSCPPQIAEISWQWTKESLPLYSKYSATNPAEACDILYRFFYSHRNESPEKVNGWLSSYKLPTIDSTNLEDFRKLCVGIRNSITYFKNQQTRAI